jgi:hypothetical protein
MWKSYTYPRPRATGRPDEKPEIDCGMAVGDLTLSRKIDPSQNDKLLITEPATVIPS